MKRSEIKAKEYEDSLDYYHYTGDEPSVAYREGYEQAEKDYIELAQLWVDSGDANIMSFKQFLKCHETQSNK